MVKLEKFSNIVDLLQVFHNEQVCIEHLKAIRWGDGEYCPYCGCNHVYEFKDGKTFKCKDCRKRFSIKVGTIFEDSKVKLQKWFVAIYLITAHKKGISSLQLSRDIGVTQKTAWFMLHRLRVAVQTESFKEPLKNTVEVDETYVGGKEKNKHAHKRTPGTQGRNTKTKTAVVGMVERHGKVKAQKVNDVKGQTVKRIVTDNIVFGTNLMSDEFTGYKGLSLYYNHQSVSHGRGEYVSGACHTNTIEGFWSLLKRGIVGIYHFVSPKHLDRYLAEYTYRYNTKDMTEEARFNNLLSNVEGRLKYSQLIG